MTTGQSLRFTIIGAFFTLLTILILGRMVRLQAEPQKEAFIHQGEITSGRSVQLIPARGKIYDRWGHLLAGNETVYEIGVDLWNEDINPETIALAGSVVLGLDYSSILVDLLQRISENSPYYVLDKFGTSDEIAHLQKLIDELEENPSGNGVSSDGKPHSLKGLNFEPYLQRIYPENNLASNVLGFVNKEPVSVYGIEGYYDDLLSGVTREYWYPYDPNRVTELPDSTEGASLILTLDREIQASVEEILDKAIENNGAYAGTIVIMNPKTGEILAMATSPRININEYWRVGEVFDEDQVFNLAIHSYEPGSVFKVFTMASALDSGTVEPDTTFVDTGVFQIGGVPIYNWNRGAWGPQTMLGCMQHSLNVCLAWVSDQMGASIFYSYLQDFGFGHPTGIELDSEVSGHLKLPGDADWYEADLGTNAFGQGISVTPVQMLTGLSAIANGGKMVAPRIVYSVIDRGRQYNTSIQIIGEPISKETANTLSDMLAVSLEEEASTALVPGYRVAGKTGTAEIPSPQGYVSSATNASFAGWGPVDDPQFIVYIWIEKPTSSPWGSVVAAPIFSEVVERLVVLLNIPPDPVRQSLTISESAP
jgi:cell division protein FtsI/penicillin-binding protein 2